MALAETDGTLKKSPKSALLHKVEGTVELVVVIPGEYAFIADGMASAKLIDVVFDVYVDKSIKVVE